MIFGILGPLQLNGNDSAAVGVNRRMQRVLLGMLLLRPNVPIPTDTLLDALWSGSPPPSATANLQSHVSHLRRLLSMATPDAEPRPRVVRGAYVLPVAEGELDATVFAELVAAGAQARTAGDPAAAVQTLTQALSHWRGPVLGDLELPADFRTVASNLEESRLEAVEELADARLALGQHRDVLTELRELAEQHPLRERMWSQLLLALFRCGHRAEALRMYDRACETLDRELGVQPGVELRAAHQRIAEGGVEASPSTPDADTPDRAATAFRQLPFDIGDFTGRAAELGGLDTATTGSDRASLVVVTGIGGIGKTALVIRWAQLALARFPDGQLFVDLRGFSPETPLQPIDALAQLLGGLGVPSDRIPLTEGEAGALYRSLLAGKRSLVVLDNAGDVAQVRPLLPGAGPTVTVVTSREQLTGLVAREGAHRIDLDVLSPGDAHDLLRSVLGPSDAGDRQLALGELARLCAYTPLALRIAATNLMDDRYQSLDGYIRKLRAGDRLASLEVVGDPYTAVEATFDLSYHRLNADERRLFRVLGVAPMLDVTREAAAATADVDPHDADRLLNRLAQVHLLSRCGVDRFTFHDLLRLHARARAEEEDPERDRIAAVRRLLDWYLCRLDQARNLAKHQYLALPDVRIPADTVGPTFRDTRSALAWCEAERHNIVMAIQEAGRAGPAEMSWLLADAIRTYLYSTWRGTDLLSVGESALAAADAAGNIEAAAAMQFCLSSAYHCSAQYDVMIDKLSAGLDLARRAGWTKAVIGGLSNIGAIHGEAGRLRTAVRYYEQAAEVIEQSGDRALLGVVTMNLGHAFAVLGQVAEAARCFEKAVANDRALGSRQSLGRALANLGFAYRLLGRYPEAISSLHTAIEICIELGDLRSAILTYYGLADAHRDLGAYERALEAVEAGLKHAAEIGYTQGEVIGKNIATTIRLRLGPDPSAAERQGEWARVMAEAGDRPNQVAILIDLAWTCCRTGAPQRALEVATRALTTAREGEFRLMEAQALTALAEAALRLDRPHEALDRCHEALPLYLQAGSPLGEAETLTIVGDAEWAAGRCADARAAWQSAKTRYETVGSALARTPAERLARSD